MMVVRCLLCGVVLVACLSTSEPPLIPSMLTADGCVRLLLQAFLAWSLADEKMHMSLVNPVTSRDMELLELARTPVDLRSLHERRSNSPVRNQMRAKWMRASLAEMVSDPTRRRCESFAADFPDEHVGELAANRARVEDMIRTSVASGILFAQNDEVSKANDAIREAKRLGALEAEVSILVDRVREAQSRVDKRIAAVC